MSLDWPTAEQLNTTIEEFGKLGMKVMVTELDVDVCVPVSGSNR